MVICCWKIVLKIIPSSLYEFLETYYILNYVANTYLYLMFDSLNFICDGFSEINSQVIDFEASYSSSYKANEFKFNNCLRTELLILILNP